MGEVWRAHPEAGGPPVAIKLLHPRAEAGERARGLFLREAILLSTVRHPNVCRLLASGETEAGELYAVLELLPGRTLQERLRLEQPPIRQALEIAGGIASGLGALHGQGIVHRDAKPANVMVSGAGAVKLLDFGLAHLEPAADLARRGEILGSPGYTAPEILRGRRGDARSDLWSVGAILHEMLSGVPAYGGGSRREIAEAVLADRRLSLDEAAPALPAPVRALVDRTLAARPEVRPATAAELVEDLARLGAALPSSATPPPAETVEPFWRRWFRRG